MIILEIKALRLKNVRFQISKHPCFLYDIGSLGVTLKELEESFEGMYIDTYRYKLPRKLMGGQKVTTKCPWCGESFDDLVKHVWKSHKKKRHDLLTIKLQNELYKLQLKMVKADKRNYFTHAVLFGSTCQYCVKANIPGREGKCALPESARNKMRSLSIMGFSCNGFDSSQLKEKLMGGIIYAKKED